MQRVLIVNFIRVDALDGDFKRLIIFLLGVNIYISVDRTNNHTVNCSRQKQLIDVVEWQLTNIRYYIGLFLDMASSLLLCCFQGRMHTWPGAAAPPGFWKIVLFDNTFGSLSPWKFFLPPLNYLINFIEKKYLISCIMK
jgi:hypothetical protein